MSADQTLQALRKSLEPKPQPKPPQPQAKPTLADAILEIPKLNNLLTQLLKEKQKETDTVSVITQLDFDIQKSVALSTRNMHPIKELTDKVSHRLAELDSLEAKYQRLIERINNVLDMLESTLKQL